MVFCQPQQKLEAIVELEEIVDNTPGLPEWFACRPDGSEPVHPAAEAASKSAVERQEGVVERQKGVVERQEVA